MTDRSGRPSAEELLRDLGSSPRLTVYLAIAPGAGKTRRLLEDGIRARQAGKRVLIGRVEIKGRPDLDALAAQLEHIAPKTVERAGASFEEFDLEAALAAKPDLVILDELAHPNAEGSTNAKRWQDALALRNADISVAGAFNVQHLENVAATAEGLIGFPIREIVPLSFLRAADQVIAIDVSTEELLTRLAAGAIVHDDDIERARAGIFRPQTLRYLREMMLRTIDDLTEPELVPQSASTALALATGQGDLSVFLRKSSYFADALDLAFNVGMVGERDVDALQRITEELSAHVVPLPMFDPGKPQLTTFKASLVTVPAGPLATRIAGRPAERDVFITDATPLAEIQDREISFSRHTQTAADRLRIGYGRLTIYLGAAAGSGKTYAMLDRAKRLLEAGTDVVGGLIETHERPDTVAMAHGIPTLPRRMADCDGVVTSELDVQTLLERKPAIALIDELAHTNAACDRHSKRYDDVLELIRAGISVITTLNIQHLEGLGDAVYRLTGQRVRETVPDDILSIADEVILIDTTPETLRERLRAGKIYRGDKIESALSNFFRVENLAALRELALREVVHARSSTRRPPPFLRMALGVKARERDIDLIERCARLALRLEIDLVVMHATKGADAESRVVTALQEACRRVRARWIEVRGDDPVTSLLSAARTQNATIVVEGARQKPRWPPRGTTFAKRLIEAGATQLVILAPQA